MNIRINKNESNILYIQHLRDYLAYFDKDTGLYLNEKSLAFLKKNLPQETYGKFCYFVANSTIIRNCENYAKTLNGEEYYKLKDKIKKFQELFYKNIEEIEEVFFFKILSKSFSVLAGYYGKKEIKDSTRIFNSWLSEICYVLNNRKGKKRTEIIKKLFSIISTMTPQGLKTEEAKRKKQSGTRRDIWINLDKELDLSKLKPGDDYWIQTLQDTSKDLPRIIEEHDDYIHIDGKRYSLSSLYKNLFSSDQKDSKKIKIPSDDLLENTLFLYITKRAQHGDDNASEILYNIYEKKAEWAAVKFIKQKENQFKIKNFSEFGSLSQEDVKAAARNILQILIKGDSPNVLLSELENTQGDKNIELILNRKIDKILAKIYDEKLTHFNLIKEHLKLKDREFRRKLKDLKYKAKRCEGKKSDTEIHYLKEILFLSQKYITDVDINCMTRDAHFDIYTNIVFSDEFNKWTYKPNKKSNLTSWLFGGGKYPGMLWYRLNDWFKDKTYTENGKRRVKDEDYDFVPLEKAEQNARGREN
jgi:hypothetical protein